MPVQMKPQTNKQIDYPKGISVLSKDKFGKQVLKFKLITTGEKQPVVSGCNKIVIC